MDSITNFLSTLLTTDGGNLTFMQIAAAVGIAYLGGVLSSLTPCVYPMIPITVSVVGGLGPNRRSWKEIWIRGISYVAGMATTYSFLGVLAGISGRVFGSFTNTSTWYLNLGLIMTLASLIMLEIIPFEPNVWWEQLKRKYQKLVKHKNPPHTHPHSTPAGEREMTALGAFTLGATSGFIAAPCTTPVLTSILAYIAKTQSVGVGLTLMVAFSAGLGTLLLIVAVFAGAIRVLPRSGQWLRMVKIISGIILLGFAEYLIFKAGTLGGL